MSNHPAVSPWRASVAVLLSLLVIALLFLPLPSKGQEKDTVEIVCEPVAAVVDRVTSAYPDAELAVDQALSPEDVAELFYAWGLTISGFDRVLVVQVPIPNDSTVVDVFLFAKGDCLLGSYVSGARAA